MKTAVAPVRRTLQQWLTWQETLHPRAIDMGLERVRSVANALGLLPFPAFCISIAGTNGKGSCAHILSRLINGEQRVGVYTSPYLVRYNERINIDGQDASDADLCRAFEAVELARGTTSLTYFEFGTLAALWLLREYEVDVAVLEVGMGARLDAVNIIDADVALITSIGLDHTDWLGDNREAIGAEKAGIMRANQTVICADRNPPASIERAACETGAALKSIAKDFDLTADAGEWHWRDWQNQTMTLPACPNLLLDNVAAVLAVLSAMRRLTEGSPEAEDCANKLVNFSVPGRRQVIEGVSDGVRLVLDVAHNLEAMQVLVKWLSAHPVKGEQHIVLGMLRNKPVEAVGPLLAPLGNLYAGGLEQTVDRGLSGVELSQRLGGAAQAYATVEQAFEQARSCAKPGDQIVVCGSFYTLAPVLAAKLEE